MIQEMIENSAENDKIEKDGKGIVLCTISSIYQRV